MSGYSRTEIIGRNCKFLQDQSAGMNIARDADSYKASSNGPLPAEASKGEEQRAEESAKRAQQAQLAEFESDATTAAGTDNDATVGSDGSAGGAGGGGATTAKSVAAAAATAVAAAANAAARPFARGGSDLFGEREAPRTTSSSFHTSFYPAYDPMQATSQQEATQLDNLQIMRRGLASAQPVRVCLNNFRKNGEKFTNLLMVSGVTVECEVE
jgi:hypothetical protein